MYESSSIMNFNLKACAILREFTNIIIFEIFLTALTFIRSVILIFYMCMNHLFTSSIKRQNMYAPLNQLVLCCSTTWHSLICCKDQLPKLQCRCRKPPDIFRWRNIHCLLASWTVDVLLSTEQKKRN